MSHLLLLHPFRYRGLKQELTSTAVLGPMVYAAAYCPMTFKSTLEELGFDDSKALSAETRQNLWEAFDVHGPLCYSSSTLSPQAISANMLRRVPINLNQQAQVSPSY